MLRVTLQEHRSFPARSTQLEGWDAVLFATQTTRPLQMSSIGHEATDTRRLGASSGPKAPHNSQTSGC